MRYLSLCSGIEAATVAWHPLGWTPVAFSEIDPFPCAVLAHHYPDVPNWGDMTKFKEWPDATVDILVGGTPCQSFSVAGLRAGLDDPRGNLALVYLAVADRYRPKWLVWENVPGVLSSDEGRAMGSILGAMAKLGYGFAYRVLDAQYVRVDGFGRAVPQRRRRVFVVGCLGDWRAAAAVLFERESLSGNTAPRREAGEGVTHGVAPCIGASGRGFERAGETRGQDPVIPLDMRQCSRGGKMTNNRDDGGAPGTGIGKAGDPAPSLASSHTPAIAHSLKAEGFDASKDGTGRGTPLVAAPLTSKPYADHEAQEAKLVPTVANPLTRRMYKGINTTADEGQTAIPVAHTVCLGSDPIYNREVAMPQTGRNGDPGVVAFDTAQITSKTNRSNPQPGDPCHTLHQGDTHHVAFKESQSGVREGEVHATLDANKGSRRVEGVRQGYAVRRLTPRECERLQGFPDDYTLVEYRGKPAKDGPRYKALGNSMACNVMRWIGRRIQMVEDVT